MSPDRFLSNLRKSGLVEEERLNQIQSESASQRVSSGEELDSLAKLLVDQRMLTAWQVTMLRNDKHKGFFVDDFVILDHLESAAGFTRYSAYDRKRNRTVVLRFSWTPKQRLCGLF